MRGWQESPDGLHDRIRYRREGGGWMTDGKGKVCGSNPGQLSSSRTRGMTW
jgi:hypothetical protein